MSKIVSVTCPYCGFVLGHNIEETYSAQVLNCDLEEGGCDKDFVIKAYFKVEYIY